MHIRNVAFARVAVAVFALLAPTAAAWAQAFPDRPITLIVPWPPGGSTDRHLRTLAEIAGRHLGQSIVVQNHPGAGGTLGPGNMAVTAKPDGYTIAQYPMGMLRLPHMQKTAWNPLTDFTFIIGVSGYTFGFTVLADSPLQDVQRIHRRRARRAGEDQLRLDRHRHIAAPADGGDRDQRQGDAQSHPVQGQRRPRAGAARRPRDGAERRDAGGTSTSTAGRCGCS